MRVDCDQAAALPAHMRKVDVRAVHQSILQTESDTVTEQGVALHLSQTDTSVLLSALHWLSGDRSDGTCTTHLRLVANHVSVAVIGVDKNRLDLSIE